VRATEKILVSPRRSGIKSRVIEFPDYKEETKGIIENIFSLNLKCVFNLCPFPIVANAIGGLILQKTGNGQLVVQERKGMSRLHGTQQYQTQYYGKTGYQLPHLFLLSTIWSP
jgi:hypothetical protein